MPASSPEADLAACRAMMRGGSRSFFAASHLLPRRILEPAYALYAFCRLADDAIDNGGDQNRALAELRDRLDAAYAGAPYDGAADRAFSAAIAEHAIPRTLPLALLEGFAWDAQGRRYDDFASLLDYAARVAGSVGAMMALLMDVRSGQALARACDLGVAMQLTNIARDVGEDARAGRLYLPRDWLEEEGVDPDAFLAHPRMNDGLRVVVRRLLDAASMLYAQGISGIAALPFGCRPGIYTAARIYEDIGRAIACADYDSVSRRARVDGRRKTMLAASSLIALLPRATARQGSALASCAYLVAAGTRESEPRRPMTHWLDIRSRAHWVLDLFARLQNEQFETP